MSDQGRIKWFNNATGWGFITGNDRRDILIRANQIRGDGFKALYTGDLVSYQLRESLSGAHAVDVNILESDITADRRQVS
jgi:cold shock protein